MATLMEWNDELDIGVNDMNDQHKVILKYMNHLYDRAEKDPSFKGSELLISQLANFTIMHFKEEETYMESIEYVAIEGHKAVHKDLLDKLNIHIQRMKVNNKLDHKFFSFLKLWLTAHIKGLDQKYADSVKKAA